MGTRRHHTPEQVVRKLREGEKLIGAGQELALVCKHLEISEATWPRWVAQYGGVKADDAKRLKELERENARLKKISRRSGSRRGHAQGADPGELVSPSRRRQATQALQERFGVSQRRACRVTGQHRSAQRRPVPAPPAGEEVLRARLREISANYPRWGWRKATRSVPATGW